MTISMQTLQRHRSPAIIPPVIPGRRGFVCPAKRAMEAGDDDAAEAYVNRRRFYFAQQRTDPFRPLVAQGPWVATSFCVVCESIRRDCDPAGFFRLPWVVSCQHQAMPVSGSGPLAPTRRYPRIERLPDDWRERVDALAECIRDQRFDQTRRPCSVPLDLLCRNLVHRTGRALAPGVLLLAFLRAGYSFGVSDDGQATRITVSSRDSLKVTDSICQSLSHHSEEQSCA